MTLWEFCYFIYNTLMLQYDTYVGYTGCLLRTTIAVIISYLLPAFWKDSSCIWFQWMLPLQNILIFMTFRMNNNVFRFKNCSAFAKYFQTSSYLLLCIQKVWIIFLELPTWSHLTDWVIVLLQTQMNNSWEIPISEFWVILLKKQSAGNWDLDGQSIKKKLSRKKSRKVEKNVFRIKNLDLFLR